jgi:hypothetical protein
LAHRVNKDKTKAAYDYAKHLPLRRVMMNLDSLRLLQPKPAIPYAAIKSALAQESLMHDPNISEAA